MSDGLNDAEGSSWERKIQLYFTEFEYLCIKILKDEPQLEEGLIKRLTNIGNHINPKRNRCTGIKMEGEV